MSCVGGTMDTKGLTGVLGDKWGDSMDEEKKKQINAESLAIWKPKRYETYYTLSFKHMNYNVFIIPVKWTDSSIDYIRLLQGMVYRTYEEADRNQQRDYEKLTGLRLTDIKLNPYI